MLIKHSMAGSAGFLDLAIVPIKNILGNGTDVPRPIQNGGMRKVALIEESGGVSVEKLLFSGEACAAELKVSSSCGTSATPKLCGSICPLSYCH